MLWLVNDAHAMARYGEGVGGAKSGELFFMCAT